MLPESNSDSPLSAARPQSSRLLAASTWLSAAMLLCLVPSNRLPAAAPNLGLSVRETNVIRFDAGGPAGSSARSVSDDDLKKDPGRFIAQMKEELKVGSFNTAAAVGEPLAEIKPDDTTLQALYSISLSAQGRLIGAKEAWTRARARSASDFMVLLAEAMILRREGQAQPALEACQRAIRLDSRHPYPWNILGSVYLDLGDLTNALASFRKTVELAPGFTVGYRNSGSVAYALGDYAGCLQWFRRCLEVTPQDPRAHYGAAIALNALGNGPQAIEELHESLRYVPQDPLVLRTLAELQIQEGQFDEAGQTAEKLKSFDAGGGRLLIADALLHKGDASGAARQLAGAAQDDPNVRFLQGCCSLLQGRHQDALEAMDAALKLDEAHLGACATRAALKLRLRQPLDSATELTNRWDASVAPLLAFLKGCDHASREQWQPALDSFRAADGLVPGFAMTGIDPAALANGLPKERSGSLALGVLYYLKNLNRSATAAFGEILEIRPESFMANYWTALVSLKGKDRNRALQALERSVVRAPSFFAALYAIGELNFGLGKTAVAADFYRRALAVKPETGVALRLGLIYENTGDIQKAKAAYRSVIQLVPEFFIGYNQLAWLCAKRGEDLDQALLLARKADSLQPGNASVLDTLGWIYYQKRLYAEAIKSLTQATRVTPDNPEIWYHLGAACQAQNENLQARNALQKALQISDKFEGAVEARRLLDSLSK
jgi:tetratricopeptide (TPR) repeat protein